MAITQTQSKPTGLGAQFANGSYFDDVVSPVSATITVGFTPRYVQVWNVTDRVSIEYYEGMAANTCVKRAAVGTATLEVVGITIGSGSTLGTFTISNNAGLAVLLQSKQLRWIAYG